ncbi:Hypothetical predicted protein [Mytilus galloprovincialis]|uniref:Apple domain-containing protein n=1 Tax=Mytilus galloprovincialis TaxID=29158 RepID=A0A8B6HHW5_MYTGA|nr:Hypothetical predicted protein [Mytilus galloprovincialis]
MVSLLLMVQQMVMGNNKISAQSRHDLSNKYEDENAAAIIFATSVIECTLVCASNTQCVSLFYNTITKSCIIHPDPFFYTILTKTAPGWKIYATQDRTSRCPIDFYFYIELDLCFIFGPSTRAGDSSCPVHGELVRIDSQAKQNYILT